MSKYRFNIAKSTHEDDEDAIPSNLEKVFGGDHDLNVAWSAPRYKIYKVLESDTVAGLYDQMMLEDPGSLSSSAFFMYSDCLQVKGDDGEWKSTYVDGEIRSLVLIYQLSLKAIIEAGVE